YRAYTLRTKTTACLYPSFRAKCINTYHIPFHRAFGASVPYRVSYPKTTVTHSKRVRRKTCHTRKPPQQSAKGKYRKNHYRHYNRTYFTGSKNPFKTNRLECI